MELTIENFRAKLFNSFMKYQEAGKNQSGKSPKVAFIHTIKGLTETFDNLLKKHLPGAKSFHIIDETLIHTVISAGKPNSYIYRRVTEHAVAAEEFGVDAVQLTCSSISETVDLVRKSISVPLLKVDEPMIRYAVNHFERIAVIATAPSTLNPTVNQLVSVAEEMNRKIEANALLCEGAYDALLRGNREKHDRIVTGYLIEATKNADAILLAQASIARVVESSPRELAIIKVPILSSPEPAVRHLAEVLKAIRS